MGWCPISFKIKAELPGPYFKLGWTQWPPSRGSPFKIQLGLIQGRHPSMIFVHVGGNNIANTNQCKIIRLLKRELYYLREIFPQSTIVWVFILPRLYWSSTPGSSDLVKMNKKRLRINRSISNFTLNNVNGKSLYIKSIDTKTTGFFRKDNVHLSDIGNELFIFSIEEAIVGFGIKTEKKFIEG